MSFLIDINADLGEGKGQDEQIMPYVSSCSVACGGHYGDDTSMRKAIRLAAQYGVKVGAHPSFPDQDNFGRKRLALSRQELSKSIFEQVLQFMALCEIEEVPLNHIKLHGALYNYAAQDAATSHAVIDALERLQVRCELYCPYGSVLHRKAENLFSLRFEGFIDRRYTSGGTLVPRSNPLAVISSPEEAWSQLRSMVENGQVKSVDGKLLNIEATTYCIHGDHVHSIEILHYLETQMNKHHYTLDR